MLRLMSQNASSLYTQTYRLVGSVVVWTKYEPGDTFDDWMVIGRVPSKGGSRYYLCECVCGNLVEVRAACLGKDSKKCSPCATKESLPKLLEYIQSIRNGNPSRVPRTFENFRVNAWGNIRKRTVNSGAKCWEPNYKRKGRKLLMTKDEFYRWISSKRNKIEKIYSKGELPSIDRVNNKLHYSIDNLQILTHSENCRKGQK